MDTTTVLPHGTAPELTSSFNLFPYVIDHDKAQAGLEAAVEATMVDGPGLWHDSGFETMEERPNDKLEVQVVFSP